MAGLAVRRYNRIVSRFVQLYLIMSALFCGLAAIALIYGHRRALAPLMLLAIVLAVIVPLRQRPGA